MGMAPADPPAFVPRFWSPATIEAELDQQGWLVDPEQVRPWGAPGNADVTTAQQRGLDESFVLLGEPGLGKSASLQEFASARAGLSPASLHLQIDLAEVVSEMQFESRFGGRELETWRNGDGRLHLYLDSFDEGKRALPTLGRLLSVKFRSWPMERCTLVLTSRTADWHESLSSALTSIYPEFGHFVLLPLRRRDAVALHDDGDGRGEALVTAIEAVGAVPLATRPLTLDLLAALFDREGELPRQSTKLYEDALQVLCDENDQARRDLAIEFSPKSRLESAAWLAAMSTFSGRSTYWVGPLAAAEQSDLTQNDWSWAERPYADADQVSSSLRSGLFAGRNPSRLGWGHASFAEYLTARWLNYSGLQTPQVRSLLVAETDAIYPQVRMVAAWLVALDPDANGWLVDLDPASFLVGIELPSERLQEKLVEALFDAAGNGLYFSDWRSDYSHLGHPGLAEQLRPRLSDTAEDVQELAIEIARRTRDVDLLPDLAALALDARFALRSRVSAATALYSMADLRPSDVLVQLARADEGTPSELRGAALLATWPHSISTQDVFQVLRTDYPRNYHGLYAMFVSHMAEAISANDLQPGLSWLRNTPDALVDERLRPVVLAVLQTAIDNFTTTGALQALIAATRHAARHGSSILDDSGDIHVVASVEQRRALVKAILQDGASTDSDYGPLELWLTPPLIEPEDFPWLVSLFNSPELNGELLGESISIAFRPDDLRHSEIVLNLPESHVVRQWLWGRWFEPVCLDSEEAESGRRTAERLRALEEKREQRFVDDSLVTDGLRKALRLVMDGAFEAYWDACVAMTIKPGARRAWGSFSYCASDHERWNALGAAERAMFLDASSAYLENGPSPDSQKLADHSIGPDIYSCWFALLSLQRLRPGGLTDLSGGAWRKLAPALIAWRYMGDSARDREDRRAVLSLAATFVRPELELGLVAQMALPTPFIRDADVDLLWSETLATTLMTVVESDPGLEHATELSVLAKRCPARIRPVLVGRMDDESVQSHRGLAVSAAATLLRYDASSSWSEMVRFMGAHPDLMREAILRYSETAGRRVPELDESSLAALYLWMSVHFPRDQDPSHEDVHVVGAREALASWRDEIVTALIGRGTAEAVLAIEDLQQRLPSEPWLARSASVARLSLTRERWDPVQPEHLRKLLESTAGRLVRTQGALTDLIVESLGRIQQRLSGETPEAPLLWDTKMGQPKTEDEVSDYLASHLKDFITPRSVVVNREVQVRRSRPSGIGERVDLRFDAIAPATQYSPDREQLTVVAEVKCCWNTDLLTSMRSQLADRYMADVGAKAGIYIVVWFDTESWSLEDSRRRAVAGMERSVIEDLLVEQQQALAGSGRKVAVVHLDASRRRVPRP